MPYSKKTGSFRVRAFIGFTLSFALLVSAGYFSFRQIDKLAETQRWVSHTHEVQKVLYELLASLNDTGSGQRGYAMTGEDSYLTLYRTGRKNVAKSIEDLRFLLKDNDTQTTNLNSLAALIDLRIAQIDEQLKLGTKIQIGSAEDRARVMRAKALMDQIRKAREGMDLHEGILLIQREDDAEKATRLTKMIAGIGSGLGFLLLALTFLQLVAENSARQKSEMALRKSEEWLHTIADNMPALIGYVDTEQRYRFNNRTYEAWHGLTPNQLHGMSMEEFMGVENYKLVKDHIEKCLGGKRVTFEREMTELKIGRFAQVTYIPHFDGNLHVIGAFVLIIDITERKIAEAEAEVARKAAEAASRSKSEFLANMSHEIRTPMNGILGMVDLVGRTSLTDQQQRHIGMIKVSANALLEIIDEILDVSKIEAGKLELDSHPFSLRDTLETAMTIMSSRAHLKDLELACHIPSDVPDGFTGDPTRLNQIILNLVGNAIKFTEKGEIFMRVAIDSQTEESACLHFSVKDSGIGVPADKQKIIFDAFTQADSSTTRRFGGTGLGLTICREFVALMGGKVWVESTPGVGSTFHFTVKLAYAKEPVPSRFMPATVDIAGRPVLVVDDNATNRFILGEMLTSWRMKATIVNDGATALKVLEQARDEGEPFSVVLVDSDMPGMDGFTLASRIKEDAAAAGTTVTMLSSAHLSRDVERCRKMGVAYLIKPVAPSTLMDSIVSAMSALTAKTFPKKTIPAGEHSEHVLRVLLAEDNLVNQAVAVGLLESLGHSTVIASNGREAVDQYEKGDFDLVLMDIQMPEMDGFAATAKIRGLQGKDEARIPIVAMTAHAMKGDRERCIAAGMDDYISKPVNPKDLLHLMMRLNLVNTALHETQGIPPAPEEKKSKAYGKIDKAALLDNFKDGEDLLKSIAGVFVEHAPKWMADIEDAISRRDAAALMASSHALKGSVSNFIQAGPYDSAMQLELKGRSGDLSGVEDIFEDLRRQIDALCETLSEFHPA